LFILFAAPPEKELEWQDTGVEGAHRFLARTYRFLTRNAERARTGAAGNPAADRQALRKLHQTVRKVTQDLETRWHFNTSIAAVMELMNELHALEAELSGGTLAEALEKVTLMLAPFVPYLAQELWEELGRQGPVFKEPWPDYDEELAREEEAEIVVQVNGRVRSHIRAAFGASREELERRALQDDKIQSLLRGRQLVKVIVVPDKLVNVVVR